MPCQYHYWSDHASNWRKYKLWNYSLFSFSSLLFLHFRYKYSPKYFNLQCQKSNFYISYKTVGKTIVLYILIFTYLDIWEDKDFWTVLQQIFCKLNVHFMSL
jgi:hypothetical protein